MNDKERTRLLVCMLSAAALLLVTIVVGCVGCGEKESRNLPPHKPPVGKSEPDLRTKLAVTSAGWNDRLSHLYVSLVVPERVNGEWNNVTIASQEIQEKVKALIDLCKNIESEVEELGEEDAKMTDRLDAMIAEFERLKEEAEAAIEGLPAEYRETARREVKTWDKGRQIVKAFKMHYGGTLDHYKSQIEIMDDLQPMLQRMMAGAKLYEEIGEFGKTVEGSQMTDFANDLNKILELFDTLARFTEKAIGEAADPAAIPDVVAVIKKDPEICLASLEVAR